MIAEFCHLCVKYRYESREEVRTVFGRLVRMEPVANPPFSWKKERYSGAVHGRLAPVRPIAKPAFSTKPEGGNRI